MPSYRSALPRAGLPLLLLSFTACEREAVRPEEPPPDVTAPRVEMVAPGSDTILPYPAGLISLRALPIRGYASDTVGVERVTYQLNGGAEHELGIVKGTSVPFTFEVRLAEGENRVVVHAFDAAGNRGSVESTRLIQDTQGPEILLDAPVSVRGAPGEWRVADSIRTSSATVRLSGRLRDPRRIGRLAYSLSYASGETIVPVEADTAAAFDFSVSVRPGSTALTLTAKDVRGYRTVLIFPVERAGVRFRAVAAGGYGVCGVSTDDELLCTRSTSPAVDPLTQVVGAGAGLTALSVGGRGSCALGRDGAAHCVDPHSPTAGLFPMGFSAIDLGGSHACGLAPAGAAYCWGDNWQGQLGIGTTYGGRTPTSVAGGLSFRSISGGFFHTCAVAADGAAYCWGSNADGQLGTGGTTSSTVPAPVASSTALRVIEAGVFHTCALDAAGAAYCWGGTNAFGELGIGPPSNTAEKVLTPTAVSGGPAFEQLALGRRHSCGLTVSGAAYCWGDNLQGQLGTGTDLPASGTPLAVAGGLSFRSISAGDEITCGRTTDDRMFCWGSTTVRVPTPAAGQ